jgi:hypothetical protein
MAPLALALWQRATPSTTSGAEAAIRKIVDAQAAAWNARDAAWYASFVSPDSRSPILSAW